MIQFSHQSPIILLLHPRPCFGRVKTFIRVDSTRLDYYAPSPDHGLPTPEPTIPNDRNCRSTNPEVGSIIACVHARIHQSETKQFLLEKRRISSCQTAKRTYIEGLVRKKRTRENQVPIPMMSDPKFTVQTKGTNFQSPPLKRTDRQTFRAVWLPLGKRLSPPKIGGTARLHIL